MTLSQTRRLHKHSTDARAYPAASVRPTGYAVSSTLGAYYRGRMEGLLGHNRSTRARFELQIEMRLAQRANKARQ